MIATLRGEITQIEENALIVEVGGVGLRVFAPAPLRGRLKAGDVVLIYTHLVVREDALSLYGFETQGDRDLFNMLLGVDGIGPRLALAVLSTLTIDAVQRAVFTEEPDMLSRVPGVGKKTAQKIILYLHDRLKPTDALAKIAALSDKDSEVLAALTALGYSVIEAQTAIQSIPKDAPDGVEERLRLALQYFQYIGLRNQDQWADEESACLFRVRSEVSMLKNKIAFIGPGVMAEAMIAGLLRQKLAKPDDLTASGPRTERGAELQKKYGIQSTTDNAAAVTHTDVVVLSVKPQRLSDVMKGLKGIRPEALVLSIVAGASIKKIGTGLKHKAIVRSMPNTPGQIGEGITVWTASHETTDEQRAVARQILGALGSEVFVEDESYLDMATALSGTGPAYVFLFTEALIDAGVHMGFPRRIAEQLVLETIQGSAKFYAQAEKHPAALRNQVTSPGGTSAEALYYLEKAGFRTAISRAVWAAYQRSVELGKEKPGHIDTHDEETT